MKYGHILLAFAHELWAMHPDKLASIVDFLAVQAAGEKFSAEEIEAKLAPATAKAVARKEGAVAIVPLRGVIANRAPMLDDISAGGATSNEAFARAFVQARDDASVKAIVIDTDTPGGAVLGTDESAQLVFSSRGSKPIIAQVNAMSASAGYWITSAADEIVVTPSGEVGSIGVYTVHEDVSAALEKLGIKRTLIGAGKYKGELASFKPLADEAIAHVQTQVDAYYGMFVDRVASNRGVASAAVRSGFGEGRMVMAKEAVRIGMADRIGTMEETLARLGVAPASTAPTGRNHAAAMRRERLALEI